MNERDCLCKLANCYNFRVNFVDSYFINYFTRNTQLEDPRIKHLANQVDKMTLQVNTLQSQSSHAFQSDPIDNLENHLLNLFQFTIRVNTNNILFQNQNRAIPRLPYNRHLYNYVMSTLIIFLYLLFKIDA